MTLCLLGPWYLNMAALTQGVSRSIQVINGVYNPGMSSLLRLNTRVNAAL